MMKFANKIIQSAVIELIKKTNKVSNNTIGKTIGVGGAYIQKVHKGKKTLSAKNFNLLCDKWNVDLTDIIDRMELSNEEYLKKRTFEMMIKAKKIDLKDLAEKTGISIFTLTDYSKGHQSISIEHFRQIAQVLNIDDDIIDEGRYGIILEFIQKGLEYIHISPDTIYAIISHIEMEINKKPQIKP